MLGIRYETEGFPTGTVPNGVAQPAVSRDDTLWTAVGIHPSASRILFDEQWETAQRVIWDVEAEIVEAGYQPDGLLVRATPWRDCLTEPDTDR